MSKLLKVIVNTLLLLAILSAGALVIPPFAGITTLVSDGMGNTNISRGAVTYAKKTVGCILYSFPLYFRNLARYADTNARFSKCSLSDCLLNKVSDHLFRNRIVSNYALLKRTDCNDISRGASNHHTCLFTNRFYLVGIAVICYNGGLL